MITPKLILALLSLTALAAAVPEYDCYKHDARGISFTHREIFTLNVAGQALTGQPRKYECTCNGNGHSADQGCERLDCRHVTEGGMVVVVVAPEEEEEEVVIGPIDPITDPTPILVVHDEQPAVTDSCYDTTLRRQIRRGESYTRPGRTSDSKHEGCKCPEGSGPIECVELNCQTATRPNSEYPPYMNVRNCWDSWLNREIENGETWEQTRSFSDYQSISGTYRCSCSYGRTRCNAVDIPCCDAQTGEWKGKRQQVSIDYQGDMMSCTCYGGRSSYRNCRFTAAPQPTITTTTAPTTTTQRSVVHRRRDQYCVNRFNGRRYQVGSTFTQQRDDGSVYKCNCTRRNTGYVQTACRKLPSSGASNSHN